MYCMENFVKYVLYLFNLLFLICGILLIIMGGIMMGEMGQFRSMEQAYNTETIPIIIIVLGGVVFIISFFGCCGAIKENICCTSVYATFMFILLCCQIALVVWLFVRHTDFDKTMSDVVQTAWNENNEEHGYPMDALQWAFGCCGLNGYQDYTAMGEAVPSSCCGSDYSTKSCPNYVYMTQPGCQAEFVYFWDHSMYIIRWGGIGVIIVEFIAILFASCLIAGIRRGGVEIYEVEIKTEQ